MNFFLPMAKAHVNIATAWHSPKVEVNHKNIGTLNCIILSSKWKLDNSNMKSSKEFIGDLDQHESVHRELNKATGIDQSQVNPIALRKAKIAYNFVLSVFG